MELVCDHCPLPVGAVEWQPRAGALAITVACKATFALAPGAMQLAAEQDGLSEEGAPTSDAPGASLRYPSDLAPHKPRVDVLLSGQAYAPGGVPVRSLAVRLAVGGLDKSIAIFADRSLGPGGELQEGAPFARMPLVYERAAGGPRSWNPAGIPVELRDPHGRRRLPNLAPPGSAPDAIVEPIGFGPIAPSWPGRLEKVGSHGLSWPGEGWCFEPIPADVDLAFFNAAPPDQQLGALPDDARITLENLHPAFPRLETALPGARPTASLQGREGVQPVSMQCDTLFIDTDRLLCVVVWRGRLAIAAPDASRRLVVRFGLPGEAAGHGLSSKPPPPAPVAVSRPRHTSPWVAHAPRRQATPSPASPAAAVAAHARLDEAPAAAAVPTARARAAPRDRAEGYSLIWFEPRAAPRVRRQPAWRALIDALDNQPMDLDLDDPSLAKDARELEQRREIFEVCAQGTPTDGAALHELLALAVRDDGKFASPLALVAGELVLGFDEIETLRATVTTVTPLMAGDVELVQAVALARELLSAPGPLSSPAVADGLTARVREAFHRGKRTVAAGYLDAQTERALIERRLYKRCEVFGQRCLRAHCVVTGSSAIPTYLPETIAAKLPLHPRFRARLLCEVDWQVDPQEPHPAALHAVALVRAMPMKRGAS